MLGAHRDRGVVVGMLNGHADQPDRPGAVYRDDRRPDNHIRRTFDDAVTGLIDTTAPSLLDGYGVGGVTAATLLVTAGDNPDRLGSERSWAGTHFVVEVPDATRQTADHHVRYEHDRVRTLAGPHRSVSAASLSSSRPRLSTGVCFGGRDFDGFFECHGAASFHGGIPVVDEDGLGVAHPQISE